MKFFDFCRNQNFRVRQGSLRSEQKEGSCILQSHSRLLEKNDIHKTANTLISVRKSWLERSFSTTIDCMICVLLLNTWMVSGNRDYQFYHEKSKKYNWLFDSFFFLLDKLNRQGFGIIAMGSTVVGLIWLMIHQLIIDIKQIFFWFVVFFVVLQYQLCHSLPWMSIHTLMMLL